MLQTFADKIFPGSHKRTPTEPGSNPPAKSTSLHSRRAHRGLVVADTEQGIADADRQRSLLGQRRAGPPAAHDNTGLEPLAIAARNIAMVFDASTPSAALNRPTIRPSSDPTPLTPLVETHVVGVAVMATYSMR